MIGYGPASEAIREQRGLPYATGADDPDYWHPVDTTAPEEVPA